MLSRYKVSSAQISLSQWIKHEPPAKKIVVRQANPREEISTDQHKMPNKPNILLKLTLSVWYGRKYFVFFHV